MTRFEGQVRDDMLALTEYLGQPDTMRICRLGDKHLGVVGESGVLLGMASIEKLEASAQKFGVLAEGRVAAIVQSISGMGYTPRTATQTKANPCPGTHASSAQVLAALQGVAGVLGRLTSLEESVGKVAGVCDSILEKVDSLGVIVKSVQESSDKSLEVGEAALKLLTQRWSQEGDKARHQGVQQAAYQGSMSALHQIFPHLGEHLQIKVPVFHPVPTAQRVSEHLPEGEGLASASCELLDLLQKHKLEDVYPGLVGYGMRNVTDLEWLNESVLQQFDMSGFLKLRLLTLAQSLTGKCKPHSSMVGTTSTPVPGLSSFTSPPTTRKSAATTHCHQQELTSSPKTLAYHDKENAVLDVDVFSWTCCC